MNIGNLEENYKKNRELAERMARHKKDPKTDKYVLYGHLVFEDGRYRPAGSKYFSMSRAGSKSSLRSSSKSIKSMSRNSSFGGLHSTEKKTKVSQNAGDGRESESNRSIRRDSGSRRMISVVGGRKFTVEYVEKPKMPRITPIIDSHLLNNRSRLTTKDSEKELKAPLNRRHFVRTTQDNERRLKHGGKTDDKKSSNISYNLFHTQENNRTSRSRSGSSNINSHNTKFIKLTKTIEEKKGVSENPSLVTAGRKRTHHLPAVSLSRNLK